MTSEFKTNKISPATGTTLTVGDSGDTVDLSTAAVTLPAVSVTAGNLTSSLDLSGKTVTLPAASVTAHVTAFDDNPLKNDIALLGFKLATSNSLSQYSLNKQIINEFTDTSGVDASASTGEVHDSGYWCGGSSDPNLEVLIQSKSATDGSTTFVDESPNNYTINVVATIEHDTAQAKFGTSSIYFNTGYLQIDSYNDVGTGDYTLEAFCLQDGGNFPTWGYVFNSKSSSEQMQFSYGKSTDKYYHNSKPIGYSGRPSNLGSWHHVVQVSKGTDNAVWIDGTRVATGTDSSNYNFVATTMYIGREWNNASSYNFRGWMDGIRITSDAKYDPADSSITVPTAHHSGTTSGGDMSLVSTATTASSAPTKGDLILLYSDQAGTGALNTDLKGYISRDGTNFTEVTLTAEGTYGSQKVAVAHDVTLTSASGTSMKWKVTTHNQSAGSKEQRIHAVSLGWS